MKTELRRPLTERGWRYLLVGCSCAVANYAIVLAVDSIGGHYSLGVFAGFLIVTPMAYALHCLCTFGTNFSVRSFLCFTAAIVTSYPLAIAVLAFLCSGLNLHVVLAYPMSVVIMFVWNFASANWAFLPASRFSTLLTSKVVKQ